MRYVLSREEGGRSFGHRTRTRFNSFRELWVKGMLFSEVLEGVEGFEDSLGFEDSSRSS